MMIRDRSRRDGRATDAEQDGGRDEEGVTTGRNMTPSTPTTPMSIDDDGNGNSMTTTTTSGHQKRQKCVRWNEQNLAKNFAERSATMKIEEIETPWHSPPRELFNDVEVDETTEEERIRERERQHEEVMAKLHDLIRADVRGESEEKAAGSTKQTDEGMCEEETRVQFHDPNARDEDFGDDAEEVVKKRLFEAKRKAFQCKGRATKRFENDQEEA